MKYFLSIVISVALSTSVMLGLVHIVPLVDQSVVINIQPVVEDFTQIREATKVWHGDLGQCSGVMVADGWMLTAAHCDQSGMLVDEFPVILAKKDVTRDLMLLRVISGCPCVNIAGSNPEIDTKVFIVGFPAYKMIGVQYLTEGRWEGYLKLDEGMQIPYGYFAATSAAAFFGNSGGGVFTQTKDGSWVLVGIVSYMLGAPTMSGVSTPESIADFLGS